MAGAHAAALGFEQRIQRDGGVVKQFGFDAEAYAFDPQFIDRNGNVVDGLWHPAVTEQLQVVVERK